ncbi:Glycosyl transferase family 2 [Candidatus Kryptonium thompsonii]|nr:Glycosyl transferase family 2 [Candidatus Kryptonium thompsoni]
MKQPRVSVIILNWNTKHFLEKFLPSVVQTNYQNLEIIVADNGSTDGSADFVRENFKSVKLITFDKNYGFCGGYNRAIEFASGDYIVLLNSDVEVTPEWLNPIINFMEENKDVFACQPKILSYFERNKFEYAGACGGFIDKFGYPFCRGRIFFYTEEDMGQYDEIKQVFLATGQRIFHVHFHVIPRYSNDGLKFKPVVKKYTDEELKKYANLIRQKINEPKTQII